MLGVEVNQILCTRVSLISIHGSCDIGHKSQEGLTQWLTLAYCLKTHRPGTATQPRHNQRFSKKQLDNGCMRHDVVLVTRSSWKKETLVLFWCLSIRRSICIQLNLSMLNWAMAPRCITTLLSLPYLILDYPQVTSYICIIKITPLCCNTWASLQNQHEEETMAQRWACRGTEYAK